MEDPDLAAIIRQLNPRRAHDLAQRCRFLAASSEGWCEPVLLAIADLVGCSNQSNNLPI